MTDYLFQVGKPPTKMVVLEDDGENVFGLYEDTSAVRYVEKESQLSVNKFEPSYEFWRILARNEDWTGRIAEFLNSADTLGVSDALPPINVLATEFSYQWSPELPKYEEKMMLHISKTILRDRVENQHWHEDYPCTEKLLRTAYQKSDEYKEVPFYLKEKSEDEDLVFDRLVDAIEEEHDTEVSEEVKYE